MGNLNACLRGLCLLASGIATVGGAAESGTETVWACRYDGLTSVLCQLLAGPPSQHEMADETLVSWAEPAAMPRRQALPSIVHVINQNPAWLASRTVRIPLHNHAHNMEAVEQLADAVMCGGRHDCRVEFERS